ncbi:hypothetical protein PGT21_008355 [Puccinia graminis f. sp. tritici]|uniref:Uncharacterized protein n=1 Tax=Puccinia graminis f. sp. tritici TaxID=56615 RepID=A0A5B0P5Y4_PUCGR|nr:hypothetical protein PGT21_008355 [Puccinia graminis f. sp. tritici]KAA1099086.1 hypothetical protein PGTUg99_015534 [Puccinia graminis f. sp. tritici]
MWPASYAHDITHLLLQKVNEPTPVPITRKNQIQSYSTHSSRIRSCKLATIALSANGFIRNHTCLAAA